jgi:hypothetical protein
VGPFPSNDHPDELIDVVDRLRRERPLVSELELDRIKLRAMGQAARESPGFLPKQKEKFMKSRLALTTLLLIGVLMAFSGIAVATGDGGSAQYGDNAGRAQYGNVAPVPGDGVGDGVGVAQADEQVGVADGGGSLPFTGFLAIPLIALGAVLAVTGTVLRRRLSRDE